MRSRWVIRALDLVPFKDPSARAILAAPIDREALTENDKDALEQGRLDYAAGKTRSLDEVAREIHGRE